MTGLITELTDPLVACVGTGGGATDQEQAIKRQLLGMQSLGNGILA